MKRRNIFVAFLAIALGASSAHGANDTTAVRYSSVRWEQEQTTSKSGESKTNYYAVVDGVTYSTNKTSMQRGRSIERFGGKPFLVLITNEKNKKGRIATL